MSPDVFVAPLKKTTCMSVLLSGVIGGLRLVQSPSSRGPDVQQGAPASCLPPNDRWWVFSVARWSWPRGHLSQAVQKQAKHGNEFAHSHKTARESRQPCLTCTTVTTHRALHTSAHGTQTATAWDVICTDQQKIHFVIKRKVRLSLNLSIFFFYIWKKLNK